MLPSEKLRLLISKLYGIDLEKYAWPEELRNVIFSLELDKTLETNATYLGEIYQYGFNIGHCGLTSRYLVIGIKGAKLHYGISDILKGTKASLDGNHAWTIINNVLVDTTLMISIPIDKMAELGYVTERIISDDSAKMLSEYDLYDNDFSEMKINQNFQEELLRINR